MRFHRLRRRDPLRPGLGVAETCLRFSNYHHLLRELVHLHSGWLPRIPPIDVKILLGIHVHEDAVFVDRLLGRLRELSGGEEFPASPGGAVRGVLETLQGLKTWEEYVTAVYCVVKPGLIDAWEAHFTSMDTLVDEPSARLLGDLLRVSSQHINGGVALTETLFREKGQAVDRAHRSVALIRDVWSSLGEDGAASPLSGLAWKLHPMPVPARPVREETLAMDAEPDAGSPKDALRRLQATSDPAGMPATIAPFLHRLLHREIVGAERSAQSSHENPGHPWEFHRAMARRSWDHVRHAQILDKALEAAGSHWGAFPIHTQELDDFAGRDASAPTRDPKSPAKVPEDQFREISNLLARHGHEVLAQVLEYYGADLAFEHRLIARN